MLEKPEMSIVLSICPSVTPADDEEGLAIGLAEDEGDCHSTARFEDVMMPPIGVSWPVLKAPKKRLFLFRLSSSTT